jgi:hypothetical protein
MKKVLPETVRHLALWYPRFGNPLIPDAKHCVSTTKRVTIKVFAASRLLTTWIATSHEEAKLDETATGAGRPFDAKGACAERSSTDPEILTG